ncbi:hypothetical protein K1719_005202 [Acacia pycnantha]|nr:hypothetical protein K1719_005202 [Acacia pycnantha]
MNRKQKKALKLFLWILALTRRLHSRTTFILATHRRFRRRSPARLSFFLSFLSLRLLSSTPPFSSRRIEQQLHYRLHETRSREEVKLKEAEALEKQRRAEMALLEAKKVASQYQKEADKCNSGMETCEEAREKAEETLEDQRKITALWELRARQRGWSPQ